MEKYDCITGYNATTLKDKWRAACNVDYGGFDLLRRPIKIIVKLKFETHK